MLGLPNYCADFERQYDWTQIGTITVQNAVLGVDGRDNASVADIAAANKVIWSPDDGTAAALIRFRVGSTASDGDSNVIQVYGAKGADYYTRLGTLTTLVGAQDWSSGHFIDSIVLTNERWSHGIRVETTVDEMGRVSINVPGYDRFLFIASTLATPCTLYIDVARLDKRIDMAVEIHSVLTAVEAGTSNLESQMETQESQLETVESELESIKADTDKVQSQLETQESQMETTETALTAIDSELVLIELIILS